MKKFCAIFILLVCLAILSGCQIPYSENPIDPKTVTVVLSDETITSDGNKVSRDQNQDLYVANDVVYYEANKDFTYGEGTENDAHSKEEADAHTVLHIAKAGTYRISGTLSQGQIAIDLGKDAKNDPKAVVTLILDGVDISCSVAPAVIFYNVYECGSTDEEKATKDVDTAAAGANVVLADGSVNNVNGSYVARIYKADTVELNEAKTEVTDAKKLHKYDAAFYSKSSMNISGEKDGSGILNIIAENEGLDSELHLTVNSGVINIQSGNDGINTNEDGISVTTINGGKLSIRVSGETGEGDGIDSNGWLVINGGTVTAEACSKSADAGIDSDKGIHINGGTVIASGSMLDRIENNGQTYAVFNFAQKQQGGEKIKLKNEKGNIAFEAKPENAYSVLIVSSPDLPAGTYTLWSDNTQLAGQSGGMQGGHGATPGGQKPEMPEGQTPPERPEGEDSPKDRIPSDKIERPKGENPRGDFPLPEDGEMPEIPFPEGGFPNFNFPNGKFPDENFSNKPETAPPTGEISTEFIIKEGANIFSGIKALSEKTTLPPDLETLKKNYPNFFGLPSEGGFVVYIWEMGENNFLCSLTDKASASITDESFVFTTGATIEEIRVILDSYQATKENVTLHPVQNSLSSYYYEIDDSYRARVNELFWK